MSAATPRHRLTLRTWESRTEWPLAGAATLFLVSYSWLVLQPGASVRLTRLLTAVDYVSWAAFAVDYVARLALVRRRGRWVVRHLVDLAIVALPLLRPLRLLRLITLLRVLDRRAARSLQGRVAAYVVLSTALVLYAGALAELSAERGAPGTNINTFGTSLWWAVSTITTVGYGDHFPVTTEGRCVAAALMIAGVALIGIVTASLASWFLGRVQAERHDDPVQVSARELAELRAEVRQLTALLQTSPPHPGPRTRG